MTQSFSEVEAAKALGVCRTTLWKLRQKGEIGYLQLGNKVRYLQKHIDEFFARCERPVSVQVEVTE